MPLTFEKNTPYTLIACGRLDDPYLFFVEAWGQRDHVEDGKVVLQFVHAAPRSPPLDVYVRTTHAGTTISRYVATLSLTAPSVPWELTLGGERVVRVELRDSGSGAMLYRSDDIVVTPRTRLLFAIGDDAGSTAGIKLVTLLTDATGHG